MKNLRSKKNTSVKWRFINVRDRLYESHRRKRQKYYREKIIELSTTLNGILKSESWFSAFFVYPLAQAINFLAPIVGVGLAIGAVYHYH